MAEDKNKSSSTTHQAPHTDNAAKLFGQMLRSAREVSGLSQAQLSETTRINIEFLSALEDGEFHRLPSPVFGRGFLRSLCKALALDPKDYIAAFDEAVRASGSEAKPSSLKINTTEGVSGVRLRSESKNDRNLLSSAAPTFRALGQLPIGTVVGVCLVAVAIPTLLWLVGRPAETPTNPAELSSNRVEDTATELPPAAQVEAASEPVVSAPEAASATAPDTGAVDSQATAASATAVQAQPAVQESQVNLQAESGTNQKQRLDIVVKESVKIKLNLDNAAWDTKDLQPGNYEFSFTENAQLLVLDAAAVEIKFNGRSLGNLGNKGRVRRLSFAAKRSEAEIGKDQKF